MHEQDAGVFRPTDAAEARQQVLLAVAELPVDHNDASGAMIPRIDRLGDQRGVLRQPLMAAFGCETGGFIAQHDDDFALHVDAGVIVVAEFAGRCAVTSKDNRSVGFAGGGEAERDEVVVELQNFLFAATGIGSGT